MLEAIEQYTHDGEVLKIHPDFDPSNPIEEGWHIGRLLCWHDKYLLGDKHTYHTWREWMSDELEGLGQATAWEERDVEDLDKGLERLVKAGYIVRVLYLYDHSGITISLSSFVNRGDYGGWDSGPVGLYIVSPKAIREHFNRKRITKELRSMAESAMEHFVEDYDAYLRGDVYGFVIERPVKCGTCEVTTDEDVSSCWGFQGDWTKNGMLLCFPENWQAWAEAEGWK